MDTIRTTTPETGVCTNAWATRHRDLGQTSEARRSPSQLSGHWFCPCWSEVPIFPCRSSRVSAFLEVPPAIQCWIPGHLHPGFPRDIRYETLGRTMTKSMGLRQEPWSTTTFKLKSSLRLHPARSLLLALSSVLSLMELFYVYFIVNDHVHAFVGD